MSGEAAQCLRLHDFLKVVGVFPIPELRPDTPETLNVSAATLKSSQATKSVLTLTTLCDFC